MSLNTAAPWHKESYDRFMNDRLPELLAARLPLAGYRVEPTGAYTCNVTITLGHASGDVELEYSDVPQPDGEGVFDIEKRHLVVVPTASQEELDVAEIRCVGEQLYDHIEQRLGEAPKDLPWDVSLARAWIPLDTWTREFIARSGQDVDDLNWLARHTHLRRLLVPDREDVIAAGQFGRTCPFETPEGPNIGRILTVALGAEIRDGRLVAIDDRPEAGLGLTASMIPFLEHNDPNRQLMGVNMMRQWMPPPDPEPALVQTGNEIDAPDFWCGRNLLTAFVSWGADTFEDGILISESCAKRLDYPHPVEPGDKLSNRHGTKGVVSRIVPDDEMPHMADGTPVELVYSFIGLHTRLNFGQIREALMGRIAHVEGETAVVPPFQAPGNEEIRERLVKAGLPEDGMELLTLGRNGKQLPRPSAVGWVYWGRTYHVAREKIHMSTTSGGSCNRQGELEYYAMRDVGAFENLMEQFNTRSVEREDADTLAARIAEGKVDQAGPPSPALAKLTRRLAAAGIRMELRKETLTFKFAPPGGKSLKLACPIPHPWLRERELADVGIFEELPEYGAVVEANSRLERIISSEAPASLTRKASADLEERAKAFFDALLKLEHLRFGTRIVFSGRTVIAPGADLRIDQVGLAEEMAWTLFGPLVTRELGGDKEVETRSKRATHALDAVMARSWVLLNRAPTWMPTAIIAFRPVRYPDRVIRLHPLICRPMNADFDGDQAAVFLPLTEAAQMEAGEKLSITGHLSRDPSLTEWICPSHEALWGLALLSLGEEGCKEIKEIVGVDVATPEGFVTHAAVADALRAVAEREGIDKMLDAAEQLMHLGFRAAKESGASMSPFVGASLQRPSAPQTHEQDPWQEYTDALAEAIFSRTDFTDQDLGVQLLAVKSGARGREAYLTSLVGANRMTPYFDGESVPIRHAFRDGLTAEELYARVVGARESLGRISLGFEDVGYELRNKCEPKGFSVLNRAMRAKHPGIVFARAAAAGEMDPLTDVDGRLFVGLPVREHL